LIRWKYFIIIVTVIIAASVFLGCGKIDTNDDLASNENGIAVTVYKDPLCGCCGDYIDELKNNGFNVKTVKTEDMQSIRDKYGISTDMESCHTMVIDDYFVEGHMPFEAIEKLLSERPDIDGIALPDMPSGTPGMPGEIREEWIIYSLKDGQISEFMRM
jgi:hypothetical protein